MLSLRFRRFGKFLLMLGVALATEIGGPALSAPPSTIPPAETCTSVVVMLDQAWWIRVRTDGPATYGYGAIPEQVLVREGVLSLTDIYDTIIEHVVERDPGARFKVVFSPMAPGHEGRVFDLSSDGPDLSELFAAAYRAPRQDLEGLKADFQLRAIRNLDRMWRDAPFQQ